MTPEFMVPAVVVVAIHLYGLGPLAVTVKN
jgi:hypothetical protein